MSNYWNKLMGTPQAAAQYMEAYGEGAGTELRYKIASYIEDGDKVLDVGAGPAWNYLHFKEYGPKVKYRAMDYSTHFIEGVKEKWPEIDYVLGDVREIKEPKESWDVVILQDVLEHTNGYRIPLRAALQVARKKVIVTFWHLTEDDDHINDVPEENDLDGWGAWYSQPKWEHFLWELNYPWQHEVLNQKHKRDIYIIDKDIGDYK